MGIDYHKFPGQGQRETPVMTFTTFLRLIPSFSKKLRKLFDQEQADLTARVLLGDRELEEALPVQRARVEAQTSPEFREKLQEGVNAETDARQGAAAPKKLTFLEAKDELVEASVSPEILASPFGAEIIATMREQGLLAALKCLREVMTIYLARETTLSEISCKASETAARIARENTKEKDETAARITREKEETAAKIAREELETKARIAKEELETAAKIAKEEAETTKAALETKARIAKEEAETTKAALETKARIAKEEAETAKAARETAARIAKEEAETAAQMKANAARLRLEQSERKQALATKNRLDNAAVDIEETKAWKMREEVLMQKQETEARIRREDLASQKQRKTTAEAMIPLSLVTATAVAFFRHALHRACPGVDAATPCPEQRIVTAFRYNCGVTDSNDEAGIVCAGCIHNPCWSRRHSVQDKRQRRRTWLYAHGAKVRGPCALCDGEEEERTLHVADGEWQCCHNVACSRGGSDNPDHRNLHPGHGGCNQQQGDSDIAAFRRNCGLEPTREPPGGGFARFAQSAFDTLDSQLGSARPKKDVILRCLQALNLPNRGGIRHYM